MDSMNTFTITQMARLLSRNVKTLQRMDREGKLVAQRTATNRRYYTQDQVNAFMRIRPVETCRRIVAYCRVSSQAQKPDLRNQRRVLEDFCVAKGWADVEYVEEVGGGLNFKRKQFLLLVDAINNGEVKAVVLAHKDRLVRFGFELLAHLCAVNNCDLVVINVEKLSPEQEMVQDLMTIIHCFSSRLYGLRNYRKSLKEALNHVDSPQDTTEAN